MKVFFGESKSGDLRQAVSGLSNPKLIIMFSNGKQFEQHVSELESLFPGLQMTLITVCTLMIFRVEVSVMRSQ